MLTLRALEILVAVADRGSVSSAARSLRLTQPAVSHQLAAMEREVGAALVDRGTRGAVLTRRGRAVVEHARRAIASAERATAAARSGDSTEPIRVVVAESFTLPFFLPVAARWNAADWTPLSLVETSSATAAIAALLDGDHDLVLAPGPVPRSDVRVVRLGTEQILAVGTTEGVTGLGAPTQDDPVPSRFIGVDAANGYSGWLAERCAERGVHLRPDVVVRSVQNAAGIADAGFGVALVPASALTPGMRSVPLTPPLQRTVVAVTRTARDPVIDELVVQLRDQVATVLRSTGPTAAGADRS